MAHSHVHLRPYVRWQVTGEHHKDGGRPRAEPLWFGFAYGVPSAWQSFQLTFACRDVAHGNAYSTELRPRQGTQTESPRTREL